MSPGLRLAHEAALGQVEQLTSMGSGVSVGTVNIEVNAELIGENGRMFGGPEQQLGIVGAFTLEPSEVVVYNIQSPVPVYTLIDSSRRLVSVPFSADGCELAELRLRCDNDESSRLRKRLWACVECQVVRSSL